ncbi:MAG: DNA mismatch repair protein MutS [Oligoflexales bacterium]
MSKPTTSEIGNMTPMMQQYYQLKVKSGEAVLFFRMGDFYEIFGEEAEEVAPKLEIALTSRERGDKNRIPFCGVPHHSAPSYWLKLLKLGYKVAIADQVEDASLAKGLVKRDIIKIMSPGCIDELEGLTSDEPNYVMAAYECPESKVWSLAVADISTGELRLGAAKSFDHLREQVEVFQPKELLVRRFCQDKVNSLLDSYCKRNHLLIGPLPEGILRDEAKQLEVLKNVFNLDSLTEHPCGAVSGGQVLIAALLSHFLSMQAATKQFLTVKPLHEPDCFSLNETVIRDLEIFETSHLRKTDGSLFKQINQTLSPMGSRALRWSLAHPYQKEEPIRQRHEAVKYLIEQGDTFLGKLRLTLKGLSDLERLSCRILGGHARPLELARARDALQKARSIRLLFSQAQAVQNEFLANIIERFSDAESVLSELEHALQESPSSLGEGSEVFKYGFDETLDKLVSYSLGGQKKVEEYCELLRQRTGISSLKIKSHKTFGLVIEVTKSNLGKIPDDFIRRQTMVNCERFVTDELKDLDETLVSAKEKAIARESDLYQELLEKLSTFKDSFSMVSSYLGLIDLIQSFAWLGVQWDFCLPKLIGHREAFVLEASRHPVVEHFVGRHNFVPNDIRMDGKSRQLLITGPNMAGKSTVMRQVAICAILSQIGCFVPARRAEIPLFDGVFTRVGAADDLSRGLSTFMVEMTEAAFILRNATEKSLVILDEVGRGTSSEDGLAIASAILEHIAKRIKCWTMFATHYHELVDLAAKEASVHLVQTEVVENKGKISFTHRLVSGASGSSFGLEVAQLAGVPDSVLKRAKHYVGTSKEQINRQVDLVSGSERKGASVAKKSDPRLFSKQQENPFSLTAQESENYPRPLTEKLERIKINKTTPLQALNILSDLKSMLNEPSQRSLFQDRQN